MMSDEPEILTPEIMPADSDSVPDSESSGSPPEFRVTLLARLKHTDLLEASRKLGSQSALARHLGVHPADLGEWINLHKFPRFLKRPDKAAEIEKKLFDLTGKTLDELFPERVRPMLGGSKLEVTRGLSNEQLGRLAASNRAAQLQIEERVNANFEMVGELRDCLEDLLRTLPDRDQEILKLRYGFGDCKEHTYDEMSRIFGITKERIRQIESRALRKLQNSHRRARLESFADDFFGEEKA
jgi:RNA polymerase sigma factor (sigma-70 family)